MGRTGKEQVYFTDLILTFGNVLRIPNIKSLDDVGVGHLPS
jgi:hypothetical protein